MGLAGAVLVAAAPGGPVQPVSPVAPGRWDDGVAQEPQQLRNGDRWQFLSAHSRMSEPVLRYELDRYLGWPGQAPSYKIGERALAAATRPGPCRSGRGVRPQVFPPPVLDIGSVGLDVLQAAVLHSGAR